jgi:hypothetical protein
VTSRIDTGVPVRLHGAWDNRSLDYAATLYLDTSAVRVVSPATEPAETVLPLATLAGATVRAGVLTLWQVDARQLRVSDSPHLDGFRARLEAAVCEFPAQTLSLRGFGSESSAPESDHDRWFEQLLQARRLAEETRTIETQRRAFDPGRLRRHAQQTHTDWAAAREDAPADRRALVAELDEVATVYWRELDALERWSIALRAAAEQPTEYVVWRTWTEAVRRCFHAADEVWTASIPALADSRGASGSLWRRVLRRGNESTG